MSVWNYSNFFFLVYLIVIESCMDKDFFDTLNILGRQKTEKKISWWLLPIVLMICAVTSFTYGSLQNNFESKQKSKKLEWHEIRHLIEKQNICYFRETLLFNCCIIRGLVTSRDYWILNFIFYIDRKYCLISFVHSSHCWIEKTAKNVKLCTKETVTNI